MRLIPHWRAHLRSYSAMALAALAALPLIWAQVPPELIALIPPDWLKWIITGVALAGFVGKFIDQGLPK